jgi:ribosomal protein L17
MIRWMIRGSLAGLILFSTTLALGEETALKGKEPVQTIDQKADEMLREAESMVEHGREGHTEEVVAHAKRMIQEVEKLIKEVTREKGEGEGAMPQLERTLTAGKETVREGEAGHQSEAFMAAREALHHARLGREILTTR